MMEFEGEVLEIPLDVIHETRLEFDSECRSAQEISIRA